MVRQCPGGFGHDGVRQARLAHEDDRAERVCEALEMASLFFGELHELPIV
jgi:hypothetical protein